MKVMVAVASRHGATWEIGSAITRVLADAGREAELVAPEEIESIDGYDSVILGSAVYLTQLLPAASALVDRFGAELSRRRLWLFASGLPSPASGARTTADLRHLAERLGAQDHRLFRGRLDRHGLSFAERVAAAGVLNREGDHRDFTAIERWANEINDALSERVDASAS